MNEPVDGWVQRAVAAARRAEGECPDADALLGLADGRLPETMRDAVATHVVECARCTAGLRMATDAEAWAAGLAPALGAALVDTNIVVLPARRPARPPIWLAIAASLLVVVGAVLFMRPRAVDDVLRGGAAVATMPVAGARLAKAPELLSWPCTAAPDAAMVEVLGVDALPRWRGPVDACAAILAPAQLAPGEYLWRVQNAAGETVLGPVSFRIGP